MPERRALFPGSFDPITLGHVDILRRSLPLFDEVIVLVATGGKAAFLPLGTRVELWRATLASIGLERACQVASFDGLLVEQYAGRDACAVVRGVRSAADYEHEWSLHMVNRKLLPGFETLWLPARDDLASLSSSLVREVARYGGPLDSLVPAPVAAAIKARVRA